MTLHLLISASKLFFSTLLIGFLNSCSQVQSAPTEAVDIPLMMIPNSKAEISYTYEKLENGKGNKATIKALMDIINTDENGALVSWITKSVQVGDLLIDETSPQAGSMFLGISIYFLAGTDGGPLRLHDRDKLISELPNSTAFDNAGSKTTEQVINFFKSMDEETLASVLFKVPSFMSVCQDSSFEIGKLNKFQVDTPNPFGEGALVSNVSYKLVSINQKSKLAKIEYRSEFDPESLRKLTLLSIEKLAPDKPLSQEEIDKLKIDRKDSADCLVDTSTGWVRNMNYSTFVISDGLTRQDIYDISINWTKE